MANKPVQLTRQMYIDAALHVLTEEGVDKLSMRKVADYLGVSPMAMYKHFVNKEDLLVATVDEFIARADVLPDEEMPWDQWLEYVARRMYQALLTASNLAPWLGSLGLGPQAAIVSDAVVKRLVDEGFTIEQALAAYFSVVQMAIGAACLRGAFLSSGFHGGTTGDKSLSSLTRTYLQQADARALQIAPRMDALIKAEQIDVGLPLIVEALRSRLAG